jgi:PPM family protein phosphatase
MKFELKAYNLQELGQRQNQEDSLYPALGQSTNDDRLFILCDGMGGHEKGEVASATVCEVMSKVIPSMWKPSEPLTDEMFQQALTAAYDALDAKDNGEERKMGTTMTFVCLHADGATVAHIGDSRVYQLRPATKTTPARIVFRTQDHSLVNDLVKIGEITEEEAKHHPQKNVITRAMQPCQEHRAKADIAHLSDIQPGDYFYMCSDGMLEEATDENILNIITMPDKTDEEKIEMLRKVTEDNKDNHTAHLIYINKVEGRIIPIVNKGNSNAKEKGMWITPEYEKPKKRKKRIWLVCLAIVAVLAVVASFFLCRGKLVPELKDADSIKEDTVKTQSIEQKGDSSNQSASFSSPAPSNDDAATVDEPSTNNDPQPPVQPRRQTTNNKHNNIVDMVIKTTANSAAEEEDDNNSNED